MFSENPEWYGDLGSPLLLKVDELLLLFSALHEIHDFLDTEPTGLENREQTFHTGHRQLLGLFTVLHSSAGLGVLEGNRFLPLGIILILLLLKGTLVLEAVEEDLAVHHTIGCILLQTKSSKRRGQIQDGIKPIGVHHVNNANSIGLQPVSRIIRQDLGIREPLDDLIEHHDVTESFGSKNGSLTNIAPHEFGTRTVHASAIKHGFRVVHTNLRNVRLAEPTGIRSCPARHVQELELILVLAFQPNLTNRRPNIAHDIGCVKQRILKRGLKLVPRIIDDYALALLVFKAFHHTVDRDALQQDTQNHQNYDGRPHYLSSRQKGRCSHHISCALQPVGKLASVPQKSHNQEVQEGHQPVGRRPASFGGHSLLRQPSVHVAAIAFPRDHLAKLLNSLPDILLETQGSALDSPNQLHTSLLGLALRLQGILLRLPLRRECLGFLKHARTFLLDPLFALRQPILIHLRLTLGTRIRVPIAFRCLHGLLSLLNGNVHYL